MTNFASHQRENERYHVGRHNRPEVRLIRKCLERVNEP